MLSMFSENEVIDQIKKIAVSLGDGWRYDEINSTNIWKYLIQGSNKKISFYMKNRHNRHYSVSASLRNGRVNQKNHNTIGLSLERSHVRLALDIKRRLLVGFDEFILKCQEEIKFDDLKEERKSILMSLIKRVIKCQKYSWNDKYHFSSKDASYGTIELKFKDEAFNIELNNITPEKAIKILAIIES